jgi:benzoyl-CoA reductase/2-hydroxyglutaryl-CoA dehydratase subunit BcrC/BadD/HgdB
MSDWPPAPARLPGMPDLSDPRYVGITTTIPAEIVFAAGLVPVDLNNIFIAAPSAAELVARAELDGYPRNVCGWIRGLYSTALACSVRRVIAVTQGDCSQTHAMMETWEAQGIEVVPFAYPYDRDVELLRAQMARLAERLGTSLAAAEAVRQGLAPIRRSVARLDELTWRAGTVTGFENHLWQVQCSDFGGDPKRFEAELGAFLAEVEAREPGPPMLRLGYAGVPPIIPDLYDFLEGHGARVVFNEVQRQFTMADAADVDLVEQYRRYTYPYSVFGRLEDINRNLGARGIEGLVHYVQSFCFRQIEDMLVKRALTVPVLTLEGDSPSALDARNRLRLEAFVETLRARRRAGR